MQAPAQQDQCKIVAVGDPNIGKTSLLVTFAEDRFPKEYVPTVFDNYTMTFNKVPLSLWDTAGQEAFKDLRPMSYEAANHFLLCFSLTEKNTMIRLKEHWVRELNEWSNGRRIRTALAKQSVVGLKADLRDAKKEGTEDGENEDGEGAKDCVSKEEGLAFAEELGLKYYETSALEGKGLKELFTDISNEFLEKDAPPPSTSMSNRLSIRMGRKPKATADSVAISTASGKAKAKKKSGGCIIL